MLAVTGGLRTDEMLRPMPEHAAVVDLPETGDNERSMNTIAILLWAERTKDFDKDEMGVPS